MLTYLQAIDQADSGKASLVSYAGGRSRYAVFTRDGDFVDVRLFRTTIARFTPLGVTLFTGGYNTATTVEALNALVGRRLGTVSGRLMLDPYTDAARPFTEGMTLRYDGGVREGEGEPPKRAGRRQRDDDGVLR